MPTFILRIDEDEQAPEGPKQYVAWSTIVDAPTVWGSREEVSEALLEWNNNDARQIAEDRWERADQYGTSDMSVRQGEWGDEWMYKQEGSLGRPQLRAILERFERDGEDADVTDLLTPLERD